MYLVSMYEEHETNAISEEHSGADKDYIQRKESATEG